MSHEKFRVGELYTHNAIMSQLKMGNSGGVRVAAKSGGVVARIVLFSTSGLEELTLLQDCLPRFGLLNPK